MESLCQVRSSFLAKFLRVFGFFLRIRTKFSSVGSGGTGVLRWLGSAGNPGGRVS